MAPIESGHDILRHVGRSPQPVPGADLEVLEAGFLERRHVGQGADPLLGGDRDRPHRAAAELLDQVGHRADHGADAAGDQVDQRRRRALVMHDENLEVRVALNSLHGQVPDRSRRLRRPR